MNGGEDSDKESSGGFVEVRCVDVHPSGPVFGRYEMEIEIHKRDEAMVRIRQSGPSGIDVGDIVERVLNS